MAGFEATVTAAADRLVVTVSGDCDLATRDELASVLLAAVTRAHVVVVDMGGVRFLDSSGVHALVTAHHAALAAGRRIQVTGAVGEAAAVLDLTGVASLLAQTDDPSTG